MNLESASFEILEFADLQGQYVSIRGLPLLSRLEFKARHDRLMALIAAAPPNETFHQVYDSSPEIRHQITTCLDLFGIGGDRVSAEMAQQLLIARPDPETGGYRPGWLIELEFPSRPATDTAPAELPPTDAEVLSAVWSHTGDLGKALDVASDPRLPGRQLIDTLAAHAAAQDPKRNSQAEKWREIARKKDQQVAAPIPQSPANPSASDLGWLGLAVQLTQPDNPN